VYLLLGGVFLAAAVHKTGFDKRLLYPFLIRSRGRVDMLLLYMMLVAGILSMWISNTATTALLIPFALSLSATVKDREASERLAKMLLIGIGVAATVGGLGTVIGSSPNAITSALLAQHGPWTFLDWMLIGMPTAFILLFLSWKVILKVMPPPDVTVDTGILERDYVLMGRVTGPEKRTIAIFGFAVIFWVSGAELGSMLGFTSAFMSAAIVSLLAAVMLFVTRTITWEDARNVPWGVFLILGAGLALGNAIIDTGAAAWITHHIFGLTFGLPLLAIIIIICFIMVAISNFLSNTASAAVFIPILLSLASEMETNLRLLVLPAAMVLTLSFITPIGTPPITLIYSLGKIDRRELAKIGILVAIPAVFICIGMVYLLNFLGLI
jgi:sodium-dependent dicarboxylate transporter 2/3/5